MPVQFTCDKCHRVLSTATRKIGAYIRCPRCRAVVWVLPRNADNALDTALVRFNESEPTAIYSAHPQGESSRWSATAGSFVALAAGVGLLVLLSWNVNRDASEADRPQPNWNELQQLSARPAAPAAPKSAVSQPPSPTRVAGPSNETSLDQPTELAKPAAEPSTEKPARPAASAPLAPDDATDLSHLTPVPLGPPIPSQPTPRVPPAPIKAEFKRMHPERTDEELRKTLVAVPELALRDETAQMLLATSSVPTPPPIFPPNQQVGRKPGDKRTSGAKQVSGPTETGIAVMCKLQPELASLPMRQGFDCRLGKEPAENLQVLSRKLRALLGQAVTNGRLDPRPDPAKLRELLLTDQPVTLDDLLTRAALGFNSSGSFDRPVKSQDWLEPDAIPALQQLLQAESKPARLVLVELLAKIDGQAATTALAQRAMFDVAADVREAAVGALRKRPADDYRPVLLTGFHYPWPPAADHAAEALVALGDEQSIPALTAIVDDCDSPSVVHELVKVNHLSNCMLCHAASTNLSDLVRGRVPVRGQPLPSLGDPPQAYYEGSGGVFVRADVTYLKQDFSVMQPVLKPGPWPAFQRYDYLARTRPATAKEKAIAARRDAAPPQRQAALFALQELQSRN